MNKEHALETLYREFYNETSEYNSSLKLDNDEDDFWLVDIYKAIIPGWKTPVSVTLSGHQISLVHPVGFRIIFGFGVIYIGPYRIHVNTLQRAISLLKFIIRDMNSLGTTMNAMTAIMTKSGLEAKKDAVISQIIRESALPIVKELMFQKNLDYIIKVKTDYISLKIGLGAKCHKEFKFCYDSFDEDYEYAKGWINGIQPGPYK